MTDLTPRQILDAIREAMDEMARQFAPSPAKKAESDRDSARETMNSVRRQRNGAA
jgi:hypothetical protein